MSTAVPKVCIHCSREVGLGVPFYQGSGVNRGVIEHADCRRMKALNAEIARLRAALQRVVDCSEDPLSAADAASALRASSSETPMKDQRSDGQ